MALQVEVVSPERILFSGEASMLITRTIGGGDIAFLEGHAPFVGALGIGVLAIHLAGSNEVLKVAVHGGFVEVSNNKVTVLSDVAEMAHHIDVDRAVEAKSQAERALALEHSAEGEAAFRRAVVRLEAAGHGVTAGH